MEVLLPWRVQMNYLGREGKVCIGICREAETIQINYKVNIRTFSKDFPNTLYWLIHVYCVKKNEYISEYVFQTLLDVLVFLKCRENLLLQSVTFLKCCFFTGIFLPHSQNNTKQIWILFKVLLVHFSKLLCTIQIHVCFYRPNERYIQRLSNDE